MSDDDRTQATALIALLAALLGTLWALQRGLDPQTVALAAGLAYGIALALTVPLQAPLGDVLATSAKYTGLTLAFSVWIALSGVYAGWELLRNRQRAVTA
ncbi:hypothetical protein [Streptomyces sp. NBC_01750]|uniref:hypothetical protein n=1 Tax=Streptomyces sp. NBC_01750 TaxID=2975928 RepID=UPI002DDB8B74|nr:hypothetical protein [Streptomyces sp. NBC_01750]WSD38104.1 hypothetical protein OG966_40350 [Streptomyces sp. NBC_01750]